MPDPAPDPAPQPAPQPAADLPPEMAAAVRGVRFGFLDAVEPCRPALYRYCRSLTRSPWDAEDLVQETLLKAFARLGQVHYELREPKAYLFRIATRTWIDRHRKSAPEAVDPVDLQPAEAAPALGPEVGEALAALAGHLPPQERAAVLLKDVFALTLAEVAGALDTTAGAVKAALHRGRARLATLRQADEPLPPARPVPAALLERFVSAFNARDIDGLAALLSAEAEAEVVGMVHEVGRARITQGSLHHTLFDEAGAPRAQRVELFGEPVVVIWYTAEDGTEAVGDLLRFAADGEALRSLRYYYFCPELLTELAGALGFPVHTNGYRYLPH